MPMYEYGCKACTGTFDLLRRMSQSDEGIVCPHCGDNHVQRKLSTFAAFTKGSSSSGEAAVTSVGAAGADAGVGRVDVIPINSDKNDSKVNRDSVSGVLIRKRDNTQYTYYDCN